MKQRFKNYALWTSIVAQVALLVQLVAFGLGFKIEDADVQTWVGVADAILALLATLGIISNPTKPESKGYNL